MRKQKGISQVECAKFLGVPIRTYQNYENDTSKESTMKYMFMMERLAEYGKIDETHGILTMEQIRNTCENVFSGLNIDYCYLFGSYAKGKPTESSDVDLLISTSLSGMEFYDLIETLRERLNKKVDVLNREQLNDNSELVNEILKDGIKIYG